MWVDYLTKICSINSLYFSGSSSYTPGSTPMDTSSTAGYSDPFTGAGRYVPPTGGSSGNTNGVVASQGADPFTGSWGYLQQSRLHAQVVSVEVGRYFSLALARAYGGEGGNEPVSN